MCSLDKAIEDIKVSFASNLISPEGFADEGILKPGHVLVDYVCAFVLIQMESNEKRNCGLPDYRKYNVHLFFFFSRLWEKGREKDKRNWLLSDSKNYNTHLSRFSYR